MSTASTQIQDLTRRLLAYKAAHDNSSGANADVAMQVIRELRLQLVKLAGVDGFRSLMSRALTLAKAEVPSLGGVRVCADGSLEGFDEIEQQHETEAAKRAGTILVVHLLELLVTFIGEPLTMRLVRDAWSDAFIDEADSRSEGKQ